MTAGEFRKIAYRHVMQELYDDSGMPPASIAIYSLFDPRDLRAVRYVGQTSAPQQRFRQHLHTARMWLPDEVPWWVKSVQLRPLYVWIRGLYLDSGHLPTMVITQWTDSRADALAAERTRIYECVKRQSLLFNAEMQALGPQIPLL
jgi:hypothetical protein